MRVPRALSAASLAAGAISAAFAQDIIPPVDEFLRRAGGRLALLDDHLFYDGGEVSQRGFTGWRRSNSANATISVDLKRSWSPDNVDMATTLYSQGATTLVNQCLLISEDENRFYAWGGSASWKNNPPPHQLWHFSPTDRGRGRWGDATIANVDVFTNLDPNALAAYVSTPNAGFIFGGFADETTSSKPRGASRGYASFNYTTMTWERNMDTPYSREGTLWAGSATFVPSFGPNGLIFVLGGKTRPSGSDASYIDFGTVLFLDPVTKEWYSQKTSGSTPAGRHNACIVGVKGSNNTYDIFMYGGESDEEDKLFGEIYALSLPGFVWTKVYESSSISRSYHVCALVGKRQLLSWGGLEARGYESQASWTSADSFPNGIGIFDLSELTWKSGYDANAEEYTAHQTIASWYEDGGMSNIEWTVPVVSSLFVADDNTSDTPSPSSSTPEPSSLSTDAITSSSGLGTGAIAGIAVGAVAVIAIAAGVVYFCLRKRKQQAAQPEKDPAPPQYPQNIMHTGYYAAHEMPSNTPAELTDTGTGWKYPQQGTLSEMDGGGVPYRR